ncbi:hypothetical protein FACS1894201_11750 [Bacteroidia bacterium]|nr:hypothetical protein FACS1894201_11750 [Bacteroidia bacterium]
MDDTGANTGKQIVKQKTLASPMVLQGVTKHPQRKHIKQYMRKIGVHKHVGQILRWKKMF